MRTLVFASILALYPQANPTTADASFDELFKKATGPAQLKQLDSWCQKNKMVDERKRVQEVLQKVMAGMKADPREAARVSGDQARQAVTDFREGRAKGVAEEVKKVLAWMGTEKYAPPEAKERLTVLVKGLLAEEPADRDSLLGDIKAIENAERSAEELKKSAPQFDSQIKAILKKFTNQIFAAVEKCLAAGEAGYAFDLYRFLLQVDPDNERAHRSLGEQKIDNKWLRPYEQEQWKAGLAWDEKAGWVLVKQRDRAEKGEVFDVQSKQWGKEADLDKLHGDVGKAWRMESEHFELISTAPHALNVKLLTRMEAFFLQAFRQYDLFFAGKGGGKAANLVFGVVPTRKKLVVNFYKDETQFKQFADPPTNWAAGFYSGGKHASFFYSIRGGESTEVMQHELTHQILGEYSDGGGGTPWIVEGAAVFLEAAEFQNGTLRLGGIKENYMLVEYRNGIRAKRPEHTIKYLTDTFGPGKNWDQGEINKNYRGAGAAIFFLMHVDGGRHRADVIQMLRDVYYGGKPKAMEEYYGMSIASLDLLMERFYRDCSVE